MNQTHKTLLALILGPAILFGAWLVMANNAAEHLTQYCGMHGEGYGSDTCNKFNEARINAN